MQTGLTAEQKNDIIQKRGGRREKVLDMLLDFQYASPEGYVDEETICFVADALGLTRARVYELVTYYAMLRDKPQARHVLELCNSSPCQFSRADEVAALLTEKLGIGPGQTTADGLFAFHFTPCVGACGIGPVIKVRDTVFGNLTDEKITELLNGLRAGSLSA